jgi:hypothetical protein
MLHLLCTFVHAKHGCAPQALNYRRVEVAVQRAATVLVLGVVRRLSAALPATAAGAQPLR